MFSLPGTVTHTAAVVGVAAQNALEVVRFGGLQTGEQSAPFDVVTHERVYRLRRYFREAGCDRAPVLLVPPLMLSADVYDVTPRSSAVRLLHEGGAEPWVVDFGAPEAEEGGLERTFTDHVLAVSDAIGRVREKTGRDVHVVGYSQGGMFCHQAAAYRRADGIRSIVTFGSPVDTRLALPLQIPDQMLESGAALLATVLGHTNVPASLARVGFQLLSPVATLRNQLTFIRQLHDREALLPREAQRRFLSNDGWVAWPGPAIAEIMRQFLATNRMLEGGFVIDDRSVTLADVTVPVLSGFGDADQLASPDSIRAISRAMPRAALYETAIPAGHFGLVVGSAAAAVTWPTVLAWTQWCESGGEVPKGIVPIREPESTAQSGVGIGSMIELAAEVSTGLVQTVSAAAAGTVRGMRGFAEEVAGQLPRLARLERVRPTSRVSLGLLLDERAAEAGDDVLFLFEDRSHTHAAVKKRIDAIVRGLLKVGVRQGEHVGVLTSTRPTGLSLVAALSRLGAIAVLLRPDGAVAREAALGEVTRIVADPELADSALEANVPVLVLGGGGQPRDLSPRVTDMERIDPDSVDVPGWYRPNPGRARDLAFIVFTGEDDRTRLSRITNGRWAVSAFGTASAAALRHTDTVYAMTPLFHPSTLLMSLGGAIASGARIALARRFDPATFWDEVRRYGVTVASYTFTLLDEIVSAPEHPGEHGHSVRLFIGSGMPRGLWRQVVERFAPAHVLEFYASTEGDAVLVNVSGVKAGCKGRRMPGSAELKLAAYDMTTGQIVQGDDGFAVECRDGEVGMLLSSPRDAVPTSGSPLRGVFTREDAWLATGDLFTRDGDGDHWLVDHAAALIATRRGLIAGFPMQESLSMADSVELAAVYGVPSSQHDGTSLVVAALTLGRGCSLEGTDIERALAGSAKDEWPDVVHVLPRLPLTASYRPATRVLHEHGLPKPGPQVWHLDDSRAGYANTAST